VAKPKSRWSAVKSKLAYYNRDSLVDLIQALYALTAENQAFVHTRLLLDDDELAPYKATIESQLASAPALARQAITQYRKAGNRLGVAELLVFYCEQYCQTYGKTVAGPPHRRDAAMLYRQALVSLARLTPREAEPLHARLECLPPVLNESRAKAPRRR